MINSNSVIVYSPSIPKKTISLLLCICINYSAVAQPDISCVSSMPNVSIKRDTINDVDNLLQRTFDGKAEGSTYTSIDLQFTQAMQINLNKLKEISLFHENWNGYGAQPLSTLVLKRAEEVVRGVYLQPRLFPTADNTIQMEYESSDDAYLEIQITSGKTYEVFFMPDKNSEGEEFFIDARVEDVNKEVGKFYASRTFY